MRYLKTDRLYCFSPPIMIATFFIEIACAFYVVYRYKLTPVTRLAVGILVGLATFQLAEYSVCEGAWGVDSLMWAKIGYVAITMLPPMGLHLATEIAGKKNPGLVGSAYASAAVFSGIFLFVGQGMQGQLCLGNYVIFDIAPWAVWPFVVYYYGWLVVALGYIWKMAGSLASKAKKRALHALAFGYAAFIIPTVGAIVVDPSAIAGIPSIMCGFAVILALVLTGSVLPRYFGPTGIAIHKSHKKSSAKA